MAQPSTLALVQKIYIAYYGRPADPAGQQFWATQIEATPGGRDAVINGFATSAEAEALFGGRTDTADRITVLYQNILGREPDQPGLAYYKGEVDAGRLTLGKLALSILDGVQNSDTQVINNRVAISDAFTAQVQSNQQAYGGDAAAAVARSFLKSVLAFADSLPQGQSQLPAWLNTVKIASEAPAKFTPLIQNGFLTDARMVSTALTQNNFDSFLNTAPVPAFVGTDLTQLNDPLLGSQWYLRNTGQRYAEGATDKPASFLDLNVADAWAKGYTGKGIVVGISDDGIDLNHPDLQANLLKDLTYNAINGATGPAAYSTATPASETALAYTPAADANEHGTVVGSIVGMTANNGVGMTGLAFDSKLVSTLVVATGAQTDKNFLYLNGKVDVSVNSYGADPAFSDQYFIAPGTAEADYTAKQREGKAIEKAATEGRNGKGMVIEVSAGNEAGNKADAGMTNFTSSRFIIASGAVTELGNKTAYTSPGASVLVSAFGGVGTAEQSVNSGFGTPSADISGNLGYNKTDGAAGDYAFQNQGTSYSGPMVGATAALMLQANPNLGFRDVSTILALTARGVGTENSYVTNGAKDWNLGGMHFSRDVGFGLVDVSAAVRLAESWTLTPGTAANWQLAQGASMNAAAAIPDNDPSTGLTVTANVTSNVRIERMEFELKLNATLPSQLKAEVTSPSGTTLTLFDQPLTKQLNNDKQPIGDEAAWPGVFSIGATAFLGESSQGTWTLKLYDKVTGEVAQYESLNVKAWGSAITEDSQYVFTNEYNRSGALEDAAGLDTLQAAATDGGITLNLNAGATSTVAQGSFTLGSSTVIENAIGGAGNDTLLGNGQANVLRGNGGADVLTGGDSGDTFVFGAIDRIATQTGKTLATADTITDFRSGNDKLSVGLAGTIGNYAEAGAVANFEAALAAAAQALTKGVQFFLTSTSADGGLLFIDGNRDGSLDGLIKLTGVSADNFTLSDIVA